MHWTDAHPYRQPRVCIYAACNEVEEGEEGWRSGGEGEGEGVAIKKKDPTYGRGKNMSVHICSI